MTGDGVKAYVYLLAESWLQEPRATLPNDDNELASMARVTLEKWLTLKNEVLSCFEIGKCEEHLGRLYNELLLEISRKHEAKQRFNNKNAKRTQKKRKQNADSDNDTDTDTVLNSQGKGGNAGGAPTWRDSFDVYCKEAEAAFDSLSKNWKWIEEKRRYHPFINIRKSLEKMFFEYWGKKDGWLKKKSSKKLVTIDWEKTADNGLSMECNQVRIPKGTVDDEQIWIDGQKKLEGGKNEPGS